MKTGLEGALKETQHVEVPGLRAQRHQHGHDAPAERDAQDGLRRADLLEKQVARHLEQEIAEEEDARPRAVDGVAPAEIVEHREFGKADIHPVEPCKDIDQRGEGQNSPGDALECPVSLLKGRDRRFRFRFHSYPPIGLCRMPSRKASLLI